MEREAIMAIGFVNISQVDSVPPKVHINSRVVSNGSHSQLVGLQSFDTRFLTRVQHRWNGRGRPEPESDGSIGDVSSQDVDLDSDHTWTREGMLPNPDAQFRR